MTAYAPMGAYPRSKMLDDKTIGTIANNYKISNGQALSSFSRNISVAFWDMIFCATQQPKIDPKNFCCTFIDSVTLGIGFFERKRNCNSQITYTFSYG